MVSVSVSKSNLKVSALCEAVSHFYAGAVSGEFVAFGRILPVELSTDGTMPEDTPLLTVPLAKVNTEGAPICSHGIDKLNDTAEPTALIRSAFTPQHDQNCIVVLVRTIVPLNSHGPRVGSLPLYSDAWLATRKGWRESKQ